MFENNFLKQNLDENRSLEETLSRAWDILSALPESELTKIKDKHIKQYYRPRNQQQSTNVGVAAAVSSSSNAT
jgi:V/A-type H+-transporting ATPase subunit B